MYQIQQNLDFCSVVNHRSTFQNRRYNKPCHWDSIVIDKLFGDHNIQFISIQVCLNGWLVEPNQCCQCKGCVTCPKVNIFQTLCKSGGLGSVQSCPDCTAELQSALNSTPYYVCTQRLLHPAMVIIGWGPVN
jgi:hypothetical protein